MNTQKTRLVLMFSIAFVTIFVSVGFCDYQIVWHTIDGGGGTSSGGQYSLTGTTGQPDAVYSAGGNYELLGGFWPAPPPTCFVDLEDFAEFALYWLETGSGLPADLDGDGDVDLADLKDFVYNWLCVCPDGWPLK